MRITTLSALSVGALTAAALLGDAVPAAALPATGIGQAAASGAQSVIQPVEFIRRPDGSVYYRRADPNSQGPYLFYYRGYAYPYYPGYAYRAERGELRPSDQPHRVKVRQ
jgi:hypothetical protein